VNVGHSPLLQQAAATPAAAAAPAGPQQAELLNARRKFSSTLESDVLDYLHYGPAQLEDCVTTMHTIFNNIVLHPDEPKYRKVRNGGYKHTHSIVSSREALNGWVVRTASQLLLSAWQEHDSALHNPGA
jgi:hypothetical protein